MTSRRDTPEEIELLSAWLDDALDAEARQALAERLAASPALSEKLRELEALDASLRALPAPRPSAELTRRMEARLTREFPHSTPEARSPLRASRRWRNRFRVPLALAASAAAAALVVLLLPGSREDLGSEDRGQLDGPVEVARTQRKGDQPTLDPGGFETQPRPIDSAAELSGAEDSSAEELVSRTLDTASDEELELVLALEALGDAPVSDSDLALIEELELIQALAALGAESLGRG